MKYQQGLVHLSVVLEAQIDLLNAQARMLKQRRAAQTSFRSTSERTLDLAASKSFAKGGMRGGEPDQVELAAAQLFRFRVMWLKEKQAK